MLLFSTRTRTCSSSRSNSAFVSPSHQRIPSLVQTVAPIAQPSRCKTQLRQARRCPGRQSDNTSATSSRARTTCERFALTAGFLDGLKRRFDKTATSGFVTLYFKTTRFKPSLLGSAWFALVQATHSVATSCLDCRQRHRRPARCTRPALPPLDSARPHPSSSSPGARGQLLT